MFLTSNIQLQRKRAAKYINSHLFNVCGCIIQLLWSALTRFLFLINIILALKRLELNAFSAWIIERGDVSTSASPLRAFSGASSLMWTSLKAFPGSVHWGGRAKPYKRLFSWKRQSESKLWTTHYTEVALCRGAKHNQTQTKDLLGRVGRC